MGKVILVDNRVTYESNEDGWHYQEFFDLVVDRSIKHIFHGERRQHVDFGIEKQRYMQDIV